MGLGDFFKDVANYAADKYNEKQDEIEEIADRLQYRDERQLFEIVYRHTKPGSMHPFNSEGMAARKVLHDNLGYEYEEINEIIREKYRASRR